MAPSASENTNYTLFLATGFLLLGWRLAPGSGDHWGLWLLCGLAALTGTLLVIGATRTIRRVRGPRPAPRTLPLWLFVWLAVAALAWHFGTPHLRWSYSPQTCVYLGWNGAQAHGAWPCSMIEMLPLRRRGQSS